jgi:hypothetical protein
MFYIEEAIIESKHKYFDNTYITSNGDQKNIKDIRKNKKIAERECKLRLEELKKRQTIKQEMKRKTELDIKEYVSEY